MSTRLCSNRLPITSLALMLLGFTIAMPVVSADNGRAIGNQTIRFATFNASLNRFNQGDLQTVLSTPGSSQPNAVAEIIQRIEPDVLLINEFDYDPVAAELFQQNYLEKWLQPGVEPIYFPYSFLAESNTGIFSGFDLDNSGAVGGPNDAFGFGFFPGQFGMLVLSRYPIVYDDIRTFQQFLWADMPGALLPDDPGSPGTGDWYSPEEQEVVRLSSKSHWDVPVLVEGRVVHVLVSHPTPPVFDDPPNYPPGVDFNGRRNHDEIRFWGDYVGPMNGSSYIYDDLGNYGGLQPGSSFVIMGDQNSDPNDGDSIPGGIQQLLDHPRINARSTPASLGAIEASLLQGGTNDAHLSDPAFDTADFADGAPGNLRVDYVLPSKNLNIKDSGVFWPLTTDPESVLTGTFPFPSSDHRAVWVDVKVPGANPR